VPYSGLCPLCRLNAPTTGSSFGSRLSSFDDWNFDRPAEREPVCDGMLNTRQRRTRAGISIAGILVNDAAKSPRRTLTPA